MAAFKSKTAPYALIAFIAGFAVLGLEITGTRLVASTLGNSIYTWSALIAAILLSMSIGSVTGGVLIDKHLHLKWLRGALLIAAITTALAPIVANAVSSGVAAMPLIQGALVECVLIFALPSFAYGAIPPLCVKLLSAANKGKNVGFSAGIVTMAGSFGSFVGALVTPFWLIPNLSLTAIFYCLAAVVVLSNFLLIGIGPFPTTSAVIVAIAGAGLGIAAASSLQQTPESPYLYDQNTPYHRIRVMEQPDEGKTARYLLLDTTLEGGKSQTAAHCRWNIRIPGSWFGSSASQ